jgi:predicted nucleic acid-binding protein
MMATSAPSPQAHSGVSAKLLVVLGKGNGEREGAGHEPDAGHAGRAPLLVLSEYVKKHPAAQVIAWLDEQDEERLFISVISIGEIVKGIVKLKAQDPARAARLDAWRKKLEQRFAARILPLDAPVMGAWGGLYGSAEGDGNKPAPLDSLLMAAAEHHGLTLVTRNADDFPGVARLFDPWQSLEVSRRI